MTAIWIALLALLVVALIRRHGWEYVPLVILIGVGRFYASEMAIGDGDGRTRPRVVRWRLARQRQDRLAPRPQWRTAVTRRWSDLP